MILSKVSGTKYKVDKLLETDQAMNGMRTGRSKGVARAQTEYAGEKTWKERRSGSSRQLSQEYMKPTRSRTISDDSMTVSVSDQLRLSCLHVSVCMCTSNLV